MRLRLAALTALVFFFGCGSAGAQHPGDVWTYLGPTIGAQWQPGTGGGGGPIIVPGSSGNLLINSAGSLGALPISSDFSSVGGLRLSVGAACFNLGPWTGALTGVACSSPQLAPGVAATNLGSVGGDLTGTWPILRINPAALPGVNPPGGDLAGPSLSNALVIGFRGVPLSTTPPSIGTSYVFNGSQFAPQAISPGINQLTGDVLAGPATGSTSATIQSGSVTNSKLAQMSAATIKGNPTNVASQPTDFTVGSGLGFSPSGVLGITQSGTSTQITVGTDCWSIVNGFVVNISVGTSCSSGDTLVADDGTTVLQADDSTTSLIVDGAVISTACTSNLVFDWSDATGCNLMSAAL